LADGYLLPHFPEGIRRWLEGCKRFLLIPSGYFYVAYNRSFECKLGLIDVPAVRSYVMFQRLSDPSVRVV